MVPGTECWVLGSPPASSLALLRVPPSCGRGDLIEAHAAPHQSPIHRSSQDRTLRMALTCHLLAYIVWA